MLELTLRAIRYLSIMDGRTVGHNLTNRQAHILDLLRNYQIYFIVLCNFVNKKMII